MMILFPGKKVIGKELYLLFSKQQYQNSWISMKQLSFTNLSYLQIKFPFIYKFKYQLMIISGREISNINNTLHSRTKLQTLETLPTLPDVNPLGSTAVFRNSQARNTPHLIGSRVATHRVSRVNALIETLPQASISFGSRVREQPLIISPVSQVSKQQSIARQIVVGTAPLQKTISETLAIRTTSPTLIPSPSVFQSTHGTVRKHSRQNIQIRQGFCIRLSNTLSGEGPMCLKCIPCWLFTLLGLVILTTIAVGAFRISKLNGGLLGLFNQDYRCREGLHFLDGKCYQCPQGSTWDGNNCVRNTVVIKGFSQNQINSGGVLNPQYEYPSQSNSNIYKSIENSGTTSDGSEYRRMTNYRRSFFERDSSNRHLRHQN